MTVLPKEINNTYQGRKIALYLFYFFTIMTVVRSLIHVFAPDGGAQTIATIPLDSFSNEGASAVILIFSLWGLSQLIMGMFYVIVSNNLQIVVRPYSLFCSIVFYLNGGMRNRRISKCQLLCKPSLAHQ